MPEAVLNEFTALVYAELLQNLLSPVRSFLQKDAAGFYSPLVSVPSPRARKSARAVRPSLHVWQSRLNSPSELFFYAVLEVTFCDVARRHLSLSGGSTGFRGQAQRTENRAEEPRL